MSAGEFYMKKFLIILLVYSTHVFSAERGSYTDISAGGGINPLAGQASVSLYYKIPLSSDPGILWNSTCVDLGISGSFSPGDCTASAFLEVEPVAFFNLKLSGTVQRYYPELGYGYQRLESAKSDYSSSALSDIDRESKNAYKLCAQPTLKFRYERVIFTDTFTLNYINTLTSDRYYYEPYSDTAHARKDRDYANSATLLYSFSSSVLAGLNSYCNKTVSTGCRSSRIAAIALFSPERNNHDGITFGALAGSYTENRNYKGELYAAAFAAYTMKND